MKETADLEAKVHEEARSRMQRVQSLGGYDVVSRRWHHFRPAESLGRPQLPSHSSHKSFSLTHSSHGKGKDPLLPALPLSGNLRVDSQHHFGPQSVSGQQLGRFQGQILAKDASHSSLTPDSKLPKGFPVPGPGTAAIKFSG
jgi:hypothetical protein